MCYDNESECQINGCLIDNFYAKSITAIINKNDFVETLAQNSTCDSNNSTSTVIFSEKNKCGYRPNLEFTFYRKCINLESILFAVVHLISYKWFNLRSDQIQKYYIFTLLYIP